MFNDYFYHKRIRKSVSAFGSLFTRIHVIRKNKSGKVISTVRVPLSYAPREKYIARINNEIGDLQREEAVALKLPRMSFEITSLIYDSTRQLPKMNQQLVSTKTNDVNKRAKLLPQVPYNITFSLSIYAKSQDDALQIVEQILPNFAPQYTLTMKPYDDYSEIKEDVPITLQSVSFLADYEGDLGSRNVIQYVLDFEMKIAFTGAINDGNIIKKSITEYNFAENVDAFDITYQPDPLNIFADSDYDYTIGYSFAEDSA